LNQFPKESVWAALCPAVACLCLCSAMGIDAVARPRSFSPPEKTSAPRSGTASAASTDTGGSLTSACVDWPAAGLVTGPGALTSANIAAGPPRCGIPRQRPLQWPSPAYPQRLTVGAPTPCSGGGRACDRVDLDTAGATCLSISRSPSPRSPRVDASMSLAYSASTIDDLRQQRTSSVAGMPSRALSPSRDGRRSPRGSFGRSTSASPSGQNDIRWGGVTVKADFTLAGGVYPAPAGLLSDDSDCPKRSNSGVFYPRAKADARPVDFGLGGGGLSQRDLSPFASPRSSRSRHSVAQGWPAGLLHSRSMSPRLFVAGRTSTGGLAPVLSSRTPNDVGRVREKSLSQLTGEKGRLDMEEKLSMADWSAAIQKVIKVTSNARKGAQLMDDKKEPKLQERTQLREKCAPAPISRAGDHKNKPGDRKLLTRRDHAAFSSRASSPRQIIIR